MGERILAVVVPAVCALTLGFWLGRSHERVVTVTSTIEKSTILFPCADGSALVLTDDHIYKIGTKPGPPGSEAHRQRSELPPRPDRIICDSGFASRAWCWLRRRGTS